MDEFHRAFPVKLLAEHGRNGGLAALLDRWVLPGEDAGNYGLRLAIRNGYLNFYVKGQSVGHLKPVAGLLHLRLHRKYKELVHARSPSAKNYAQKYETINASDLAVTSPDSIDGWIRTAETYAGDEKRFVDDLVAVTPGTLDLEMGLPADEDAVGKDRTAPRMDMVVAQGREIAFWEAKCAVNSELRARAPYREQPDGSYEEGQHVLWQLRRYERWVGRPSRLAQIRDAYVQTARLLVELAETFDKRGAAVAAWRDLIDAGDDASVVLPPGIVIAGYCPLRADGAPRAESCVYGAKTASFGKHEDRLRRHGATLVKVNEQPTGPVLRNLSPGSITAVEQNAV